MRFFRGPKGTLREAPIAGVRRFKDGGSTFVALKDGGELYVPARRGPAGDLPREPYLQAGGQKLALERLDAQKADLAAIGVNPDELKLGPVHTPCATVLGPPPAARAKER
jgi:hypothetical protein